MLHSFYKDTAPRHVRDFYFARLYRAANSEMNHYNPPYDHHPEATDDPASRYMSIPRNRPRGDDGRFVPRADEELPVDTRDRKICGWCRTITTSQWRVGPTNGSVEMGTLCNACGINYRRALAKSPDGTLDLDRLAQQMGHTRLSIQKALKRQRKLAAPPHQFKRSRTTSRADRFTTRPADRFPINPRIALSNSSSLTMLLSDDSLQGARNPTTTPTRPVSALDSLETPSFYSVPTAPRSTYTSHPLTSTPQHLPTSQEFTTPSPHSLYTQSSSERTMPRIRPDDQSPLPPFQSFIGDLQRRTLISESEEGKQVLVSHR